MVSLFVFFFLKGCSLFFLFYFGNVCLVSVPSVRFSSSGMAGRFPTLVSSTCFSLLLLPHHPSLLSSLSVCCMFLVCLVPAPPLGVLWSFPQPFWIGLHVLDLTSWYQDLQFKISELAASTSGSQPFSNPDPSPAVPTVGHGVAAGLHLGWPHNTQMWRTRFGLKLSLN